MSTDNKPKIEPRQLSLAQLQRLAVRGSQRARVELEWRMAKVSAQEHPAPQALVKSTPQPSRPALATPGRSTAAQSMHAHHHPPATPKPKLVTAASLDEMAALAAASGVTRGTPGMTFPGNHEAPPPPSHDAEILRLQALARQDEARQSAAGPPGLVGLALMFWGALVLLGGLALLTHKGGLYYILAGLACAAIGWLLLRCKRTAIWTHAACVLIALPWAWYGYAGSTLFTALIQSAPIWIAALWIVVPSVREPLS